MNYLYIFLAIVLLITAGLVVDHYRMRKIAMSRGKPDICAYARSFDFRNTDTKIMREVYNSVQEWAGKYDGIAFPVQSSDSFESLYKMDPDDLDDIYIEVAEKLGISIKEAEKNPYFEQVKTVKDLVLFLNNQPKLKNA
ncbi:hypothetical protein [Teredinibacter turnerae]|nr:hypothetical protein [Teredinibacter turnerae]